MGRAYPGETPIDGARYRPLTQVKHAFAQASKMRSMPGAGRPPKRGVIDDSSWLSCCHTCLVRRLGFLELRRQAYINEEVTMYEQILVALDGSKTSERVLSEAVKIAGLTHGKIHAVYVVDKTPLFNYAGYYDPIALLDALRKDGRSVLQSAESACEQAGIPCDAELVETERLNEDVAAALQHCAERTGAELVVLGTHGRRGVRRIVLGSVAERFVRFARCPVLLVHGNGPEHGAQGEG